jgi:hypothetical protein
MTIDEMKKRLEDYGYVFSDKTVIPTAEEPVLRPLHFWMPVYRILKSPRNDHNNLFRSFRDMVQIIEHEEEIIRKRRSERIETILGHANK